jgi:hypothetical protein
MSRIYKDHEADSLIPRGMAAAVSYTASAAKPIALMGGFRLLGGFRLRGSFQRLGSCRYR